MAGSDNVLRWERCIVLILLEALYEHDKRRDRDRTTAAARVRGPRSRSPALTIVLTLLTLHFGALYSYECKGA